MNDGHSIGYFPYGRGCRQDDPFTAYLFIEVLFVQVPENGEINGINDDGREIKLSAFADDADLFVSNMKS